MRMSDWPADAQFLFRSRKRRRLLGALAVPFFVALTAIGLDLETFTCWDIIWGFPLHPKVENFWQGVNGNQVNGLLRLQEYDGEMTPPGFRRRKRALATGHMPIYHVKPSDLNVYALVLPIRLFFTISFQIALPAWEFADRPSCEVTWMMTTTGAPSASDLGE